MPYSNFGVLFTLSRISLWISSQATCLTLGVFTGVILHTCSPRRVSTTSRPVSSTSSTRLERWCCASRIVAVFIIQQNDAQGGKVNAAVRFPFSTIEVRWSMVEFE
jgi:hypothetical protein